MSQWEKQSNDLALLDEEFCSKLFEQKYIKKFARVTSLTFDELPVAYIEGRVTSGTINIDGSSNVRRTFSLTLTAQNIDINDYYWGIKTKVKLEIGLENNLKDKENYTKYPSVIWFNQGKYVISTFNTSVATNGYTINISGKDKMCLLNGDLGGQLYASIDFGAEEQIRKLFKTAILTDTSMETIMAGNYYFIPDEDNLPDIVSNQNRTYEFQPINIDPPFYIREGSNYRKIGIDNQINISGLQKYRLYKKVINPDEILELIPYEEPQEQPQEQPSEPVINPGTLPDSDTILVDPSLDSKPPEEPFEEPPTQPTLDPDPGQQQQQQGQGQDAPYQATRVTGLCPIQTTLPPEYNDDDDNDSYDDDESDFIYEEGSYPIRTGADRHIATYKNKRKSKKNDDTYTEYNKYMTVTRYEGNHEMVVPDGTLSEVDD